MSQKNKSTKRTATSNNDPVTRYAQDVLEGRITTGPWVRLACKRHLSDLERTDLIWDLGSQEKAGFRNMGDFFFPGRAPA